MPGQSNARQKLLGRLLGRSLMLVLVGAGIAMSSPTKADVPWVILAGGPQWNESSPAQVHGVDGHMFCVLSYMNGAFQGMGESVQIQESAGWNWTGTATSQAGGLSAQAFCFPTTGFQADTNFRAVRSGFWVGRAGGSCGRPPAAAASTPGNAVSFISGISGDMNGGGESIVIAQAADASSTSQVQVNTCGGGSHVRGYAINYAVDEKASARFLGGTFHARAAGGSQQSVDMVPVDQAMCGFTAISGKFRGAGETVQIAAERDARQTLIWRLKVSAGSDAGVDVSARCFARDQRASSSRSAGTSGASQANGQPAAQGSRFPTCAMATYNFCLTPPGSGGLAKNFPISACSPDQALDMLLKQVGQDQKVYIVPRPC